MSHFVIFLLINNYKINLNEFVLLNLFFAQLIIHFMSNIIFNFIFGWQKPF